MALGRLEPQFEQEFTSWQREPTPQSTGALLRKLQPTIDQGISASVGRSVGPNVRSRARRLTLDAVKSYDPQQAKLSTHVINHLKGLRRYQRQQQQILSVPERLSIDRQYLQQAEDELNDRLGREPTIDELADHAKISRRRISRIRSYRPPVAEGSLLSMTSPDNDQFSPTIEGPESDVIVEAVYGDQDSVGQKIMEWTLGLHGTQPLSNQEIARRLRVTPGAVSQRKAMIQRQLQQMEEADLF